MREMRRLHARGLVIAAVLAAAAACTDTQPPPVAAAATIADSAEQVLFGVRSALVGGGVRRGELFSDTLFMFEQGTRMELRGVRVNFFKETGALDGTLTSREGTYNTRTQIMEARGNVLVQTQDGRRLTSPELRFLTTENIIRSDSSFVMERPGERVTGVGFASDPDLRNIRIERTTRASGGAVVIPGQGQ